MAYGSYVKSFGSGLGRYKGGNYKTRAQVEKQSADYARKNDNWERESKVWDKMGTLDTKSWK